MTATKNREAKLRELLGDEYYYDFVAVSNWTWTGPVTINELLDNGVQNVEPWPQESDGVYLISEQSWERKPYLECKPLYVGSTTGQSPRFRTRIGDLVADLFGFFVSDASR